MLCYIKKTTLVSGREDQFDEYFRPQPSKAGHQKTMHLEPLGELTTQV